MWAEAWYVLLQQLMGRLLKKVECRCLVAVRRDERQEMSPRAAALHVRGASIQWKVADGVRLRVLKSCCRRYLLWRSRAFWYRLMRGAQNAVISGLSHPLLGEERSAASGRAASFAKIPRRRIPQPWLSTWCWVRCRWVGARRYFLEMAEVAARTRANAGGAIVVSRLSWSMRRCGSMQTRVTPRTHGDRRRGSTAQRRSQSEAKEPAGRVRVGASLMRGAFPQAARAPALPTFGCQRDSRALQTPT